MARYSLETLAWRSAAIGAAIGLIGITVVSCGGDDVTCGSGTIRKGSTCVVKATTNPDGGDGSDGSDGSQNAGAVISFDGVTSVAPVNETSLQITWQAAMASLSPSDQLTYNVYVATTAGAENFSHPTAVSPPGATSLVIADLQADTNYFVVVRAVDQQGNMDMPSTPVEMSGMTGKDTTPPTFGGALKAVATKGSGNSVTVSWDAAMDDSTPAAGIGYEVFWSDSSSKGSQPSTLGAVTSPGATSAVVDHLPAPMSEYSFLVRALDAAGNQDDNTVVVSGKTGADVTPPVFGGCTAVTNPGAANATLSWNPATDDVSLPANITYNVYAVDSAIDSMTAFGLPNGSFKGVTTGVVQGLLPDTTYYFVCRAEDEATNEDTNISYRIAKTLSDKKPPTATSITNTTLEANSVTLTWSKSTDNETSDDQIQYVVYQSAQPNPASDPSNAITPGPELGATSISIANLASNTLYFWAVVAKDSAGNPSAASDDVSGTTLVSFEGDVQPIFTTNCAKSGCHSNNAPMQGQDLSEGDAFANIVGVPTRYPTDMNPNFGCKHLNRVQPNDPDNSFILYKLKHSVQLTSNAACTLAQKSAPFKDPGSCCTCAACIDNTWNFGEGMPKDLCESDPSCPALSDATIAVIETWIKQGALDN